MAEPRSASEEARDPSTTPERLLELTEKHPQLHRLIVQNPSCPEVARQWILATNPWAKQEYEQHLAATGADPDDAAVDDTARNGSLVDDTTDDNSAGDDSAVYEATAGSAAPDEATAGAPPLEDAALASPPVGEPVDVSAADPVVSPTDPVVAPSSEPDPDAVSAWGDYPEESVWGEIPASDSPQSTMALPPFASTGAPSESSPAVRVATDHVVPLGQAAPAAPPLPPPGTPAFDGADEPPAEDSGTGRRRMWFACGGCLLLALLLLVVAVVVGRAWLADDSEEYSRDSSTTAATPQEHGDDSEAPTPEEEPVSPAPEGATEMSELRSPTGNISCSLEEDSVGCSVAERDYDDAGLEDCANGPYSIQVADGESASACGESFGSESAESLEYGESAVRGDVACTSESEGMTCWNVRTGHGFMVNRATYETF